MTSYTPKKFSLESLRPHCQWLAFAVGTALVGASLMLTQFGN